MHCPCVSLGEFRTIRFIPNWYIYTFHACTCFIPFSNSFTYTFLPKHHLYNSEVEWYISWDSRKGNRVWLISITFGLYFETWNPCVPFYHTRPLYHLYGVCKLFTSFLNSCYTLNLCHALYLFSFERISFHIYITRTYYYVVHKTWLASILEGLGVT